VRRRISFSPSEMLNVRFDRASPRLHSISENASKTEPAKLLAVFVVDTDEKELLTPLEK
jgi:hypothetical protein